MPTAVVTTISPLERPNASGNKIIKEYVGDKEFGALIISDRYDFSSDNLISKVLTILLLFFCFYLLSKLAISLLPY